LLVISIFLYPPWWAGGKIRAFNPALGVKTDFFNGSLNTPYNPVIKEIREKIVT
jgi:hypothetical protein